MTDPDVISAESTDEFRNQLRGIVMTEKVVGLFKHNHKDHVLLTVGEGFGNRDGKLRADILTSGIQMLSGAGDGLHIRFEDRQANEQLQPPSLDVRNLENSKTQVVARVDSRWKQRWGLLDIEEESREDFQKKSSLIDYQR